MSEAQKIDWAKWAAVFIALAGGVIHLHMQVATVAGEVKYSTETMKATNEALKELVVEVTKNRESVLVMQGNRYSSADHKEYALAVDGRLGRIEERLLIIEQRLEK